MEHAWACSDEQRRVKACMERAVMCRGPRGVQWHAEACKEHAVACRGMHECAVACSNQSKYFKLRVIYGYINIHHTLALGNTLLFYCESLLFSDAVRC